MAERSPAPLPCPVYLGGALARRWEELAPELQKLGTLDTLNVDIAGKYILAENEYLKVSALVQEAIGGGDGRQQGDHMRTDCHASVSTGSQ